jgi:hypothetical protein
MFRYAVTETSYPFLFTDIAVVTTGEIDLFTAAGALTGTIPKPNADLQSLEFDPVNEVLFVSDDTNSNYSIYTVSLQGDLALQPFIQSENFIILLLSCQRKLLYDIKIHALDVSQFWVMALMGKQRRVTRIHAYEQV